MRSLTLALFALAPALVCAQPRGVYLRACDPKDAELLEQLAEEADGQRAAEIADRLLANLAHRERGDGLLEIKPLEHRALRAEALRRIAARPSLVQALRAHQTRLALGAAEAEQLSAAMRLRRFPFSDAAAEAAELLWSRASEAGDHPACFAMVETLRRWHPQRLARPAAQARLARLYAEVGDDVAARGALAKLEEGSELEARTSLAVKTAASQRGETTPPRAAAGQRLRELANRRVAGAEEDARTHSPAHASLSGERVVVSNGARLSVFDLAGALIGQVPATEAGTTDVPPASSGFQARPVSRAGVTYAPLVVERWLAPGRGQAGGDPAIAGRFYALLALDAARARVLWWDGDAGRGRGLPPGWRDADPKLRDLLLRGHTVDVVCDEGRVYVALSLKGEEPELWIFAYEVHGDGGTLALEAAWPAATYLLSSERSRGSAEEEPVAAEVVAALSLDGRGRLLCTTNLGLAACLSVRDGELLWVREAVPAPRRPGGFRLRSSERAPEPPPEPARPLTVGGEPRALFLAGSQLLCVRLEDGSTVWTRDRGEAQRTLILDRLVVAYGGSEAAVCAPDGSLLQPVRGMLRFPVVGQAAFSQGSVFFPTLKGGGRPILYLERCELTGRGLVRAQTNATQALSSVTDPVNLRPIPGGLVATSRSRVVFLRWE